MKFFWKLYFSIMVITMSCFSIGSYMLIESGFHATLEREVENAYHENDIISSILNNLFFYDITVELKDGTVVENLSTSPRSCESGNTYSIFQTFDSPVNIEDVAGIRIEGKDFNLWFPVEVE